MRTIQIATTLGLLFTLACGGEPAADQERQPAGEAAGEAEQAAAELTVPDWMQVDHDAQAVTMEIVAGQTSANNNWNFQGYANGQAEVVVPAGYSVQIDFRNEDATMAHSLGIDEVESSWPAMFQDPQPVFEGAITSGATQIQNATQSGESETITFTAGEAGEYAMVCYVPGHAIAGMWIRFTVSAEGEAGFRTTS